MKNLILAIAMIAFVTISCNQKKNESATETTTLETNKDTTQLYACPMHPEIIGKKGATCSECGMQLTEPVATTDKK